MYHLTVPDINGYVVDPASVSIEEQIARLRRRR
jgi:hypothetical protein